MRSIKHVIQKARQTNRSKEFSKAATNENIFGKNHSVTKEREKSSKNYFKEIRNTTDLNRENIT